MRMIAITFGIGAALAGVAGALLANQYFVWPTGGVTLTVFAYMAVVIGGWGSVPGAVLGAMIIALFQVVVASFVSSTAATILLYVAVLCVFLCARRPARRADAAPGLTRDRGRAPPPHSRARAAGAARVFAAPCRGARGDRGLWRFRRRRLRPEIPTLVCCYAIMVIGFQFIFGHVGAVSLAQSTFFGLGGYVTGLTSVAFGLDAIFILRTIPSICRNSAALSI